MEPVTYQVGSSILTGARRTAIRNPRSRSAYVTCIADLWYLLAEVKGERQRHSERVHTSKSVLQKIKGETAVRIPGKIRWLTHGAAYML